jgi:xanthine dehydrogenase small subunit
VPGPIEFTLNGSPIVLEAVPPSRTVLEFLREDRGLKGTKEGCAEGDCGACTVVVAERVADRACFRAVNACIQFVPALHGKGLLTVEGITPTAGLHPVQQAMVDCHASQCGFCTPGVVMSLFALFKSATQASRDEVEAALSGNLCRCTGYRPIVDAGMSMFAMSPAPMPGSLNLPGPRPDDLRCLPERSWSAPMPKTLAALADAYAANPQALLVAGSTDLGLTVTKGLKEMSSVLFTTQVAELRHIRQDAEGIEIGAAVSLTDAFAALDVLYPELRKLWRRFASPPIRNAGTLGGNVANGSPIGDSLPVLLALGASVCLRRGNVSRVLPVDQFYLAYQKNAMQPGELLVGVRIPPRPAGLMLRAYKVAKRCDQDICTVLAAVALRLQDGRVIEARVAYGGMAATAARARHVEAALQGRCWDEAAVERAIADLPRDFTPISDHRGSAEYRLHVAGQLLRRAWLESTASRAAPVTVF